MTDKKVKFIDRVLTLQSKLAEIIENGSCTEQRIAIEKLVYLDTLLDYCTTVQ